MIEKVNPSHPDKIADRIAGAIVDLAYKKNRNPKVAVEVLIGHERCHVIIETSEVFSFKEIAKIVNRIAEKVKLDLQEVKQDKHLYKNQNKKIRCGDNGIFKGVPIRMCDIVISEIARNIYERYRCDGKYILDDNGRLIICQSNAHKKELKRLYPTAVINPLGYWTGGINVDTGATNRKLGSDMAESVTGGGLHGKDLSKADVSVNIYAFLKAQFTGKVVNISCAIGDEIVDDRPYKEIVEIAREFINLMGGFEKFAEWGLY